jgi:aspartate aminotransferase
MTKPDMLKSLRGHVNAIEETGILKVVLHGIDREGIIPLWVGEGDVSTPEFICQAASDSLMRGETFYTHQRGIPELRREITDYMNRTFDIDTDIERHSLTNSGMAALSLTMQMLLEQGDEVVIIGPVWPNIYSVVNLAGAVVRHATINLGPDGWVLDLDELFRAVGDKTKAIFINAPGNPTGWTITEDEQHRILEFARARDVWIIADEVYHQLVFDRDSAPSFLQIAESDDKLLVMNSFSKSWLMTGWRMGWITHPAALGDTIAKITQITTSGVPPFLQHGAIAAMRDGDHVIRDLRQRCLVGRDLVFDRLESWPMVKAVRPKGAFYAFFTVDGVIDSLAYCKELIDKCNVGLAPGNAFGPSGEGYLRLCYAATPERLNAAMDALEPVLGKGRRQAD